MIRAQFSTGEGFDLYSSMIRAYQHSWIPFTHVDIIIGGREHIAPTGWLIGARSDGVRARPPNYEKWAHTAVVELPCSDAVETAFYKFIFAQIGKSYDWSAIKQMAKINFVPGLPTPKREWNKATSWFCSELFLAALEESKFFPFPLAAPANVLTPADALLVTSGFCNAFEKMKVARGK